MSKGVQIIWNAYFHISAVFQEIYNSTDVLCLVALLFGNESSPGRHVGAIDPSCTVVNVIQDAFDNAKFLCDQYYMASPNLVVTEHNGRK